MTTTLAAPATALSAPRHDLRGIRDDFPILRNSTDANGRPLTFLDSAASSQKPEVVLAAIDDYYRTANANIHRGVYRLSEEATGRYERARQTVAAFIGAPMARECVFVRNTTEAINLVAMTWGRRNIGPGDLIV
ncbi:MAG: aminotransferase class V-fold PLP-dependent enzyme, partial [Chloroflexota bacterium]|nr:aminotransferase class V-fold PLP-dependent enzyme [Chloroflexota bacterium]